MGMGWDGDQVGFVGDGDNFTGARWG